MTLWKRLQHALALVAGITLGLPTLAWTEDAKPTAPIARVPQGIVPDVALTRDGSFRGTLVDGFRQPLAKTQVILKQDGQLVTTVQTNDKGEYTLPGLKSGAYQLVIKDQTVAVRLWKATAAPAKAMKQLDMAYAPDQVVRAQMGYLDPVNTSLLILGVTGVVLGAVAISELSELQDDVDKLQSP